MEIRKDKYDPRFSYFHLQGVDELRAFLKGEKPEVGMKALLKVEGLKVPEQGNFCVAADWLSGGQIAWLLKLNRCLWLRDRFADKLAVLENAAKIIEGILGPSTVRSVDAYNQEWIWRLDWWRIPDPRNILFPVVGGWRPAVYGEPNSVMVHDFLTDNPNPPHPWHKRALSCEGYDVAEVAPDSGRFLVTYEPSSFTREVIYSGMEKFGMRLVAAGGVTLEEVFKTFEGEIITVARRVVAGNSGSGRRVTYSDAEITAAECAPLFMTLGVCGTPYFLWEPMERFFKQNHSKIYGADWVSVPIDPEKNTKFALERLPQWEFVKPFPLWESSAKRSYVPYEN